MPKPLCAPSLPILQHLRAVAAAAKHGPAQSPELRQTLDALAATGFPCATVEAFWRAAGEPHDSVRRTWIAAELAIVEQAFVPIPVAAE